MSAKDNKTKDREKKLQKAIMQQTINSDRLTQTKTNMVYEKYSEIRKTKAKPVDRSEDYVPENMYSQYGDATPKGEDNLKSDPDLPNNTSMLSKIENEDEKDQD